MSKQDIMEGHRLIRDFQREREKEIDITDFEWKELGIIKNQLLESIENLKEEVGKTNREEEQIDIVGDILVLKSYITNCINMEKGMNVISKKYGWDK